MRIEGISLPVQAVLKALSRSDTPFRMARGGAMPQAEPQAQPPVSSLQAQTSVAMLVALAATSETTLERRKREAKPVAKGLGLLEKLHEADLSGAAEPAPELMEELAQWAESFTLPDDPELQQLARDVELRVKVELARHERLV